jgi:hypothetical protein
MIQRYTRNGIRAANRKTVAAMLVFWLNLALLPCAMAFEAVETEHDCCPPTVELQQLDCCEIDSVTRDHRDSEDFGVAIIGASEFRSPPLSVRATVLKTSRPPDPGGTPPRIHVLNCVYLK